MKNKQTEWPWNRPWLWLLFLAGTLLVGAGVLAFPLFSPVGCSAGEGPGSGACERQVPMNWVVWLALAIVLAFFVRFSIGLVRAIRFSRSHTGFRP
ncbi:hypothetical protein BIU82_12525 [Arthrobacter sp. SW1]|uniref:hypothetical protein n=1 Tax=Arthrobacter sp. SW1 TaxID=1920889 RepID=UPI000877E8C1|nr:hypothetical protein [Arthrobacter sp. SW1]OFI36588.1 hypothetical protein BIU82_12525 [Arthrobacter sp. SW1]